MPSLCPADDLEGGSVHSRMTEALQKALEIRKVRKGERIFPYSLEYVGRQLRTIRKEMRLDGVRIQDLRHTFRKHGRKGCLGRSIYRPGIDGA